MKYFVLSLALINIVWSYSSAYKKVRYKTYFGSCPTKVVGTLTLKLVKLFEKKSSLKDLKEYIIKNNSEDKHYLSSYDINYDPLTKFLKFSYKCPEPLLKVQIFKNNENKSYSAVLVDGGKLFDAVYEVLLRADNKLNYELPTLVLPIEEMNKSLLGDISYLVKNLPLGFRKKISEIITDEKNNITLIMSVTDKPVSVFVGNDSWELKLTKLQKLISFMEEKKKIPIVINITNIKKVVVKFSDTL